jgi:hypothetical protein
MNTNEHESMAGGRASSQPLFVRRFSWIAAVLMLIAAGIGFCILRPRDPVSAGKPLSYWLEQIALNPRSADEAVSAVRMMGTNVIPRLLADLKGDRPMLWEYRVNRLLDKQSLISPRFHGLEDRRRRAKWGFFALAADATPAIPWLVQEIEAKPVPTEELFALAFTGDGAIPFLITNLTNETRTYVPASAALAVATAVQLDRISLSNAQVFVPLFTQMLLSTNPRTKAKAEIALNHTRSKASEGVPNSKK